MADYEANFTLEPQPTIEADFSINISNGDHNQLTNRDKADQHPISAITGLQDALNTIPTDYVSDAELEAALLEKQDVIHDLSEIRQGAILGATAVQPADLESYATTDYVDDGLSEKQDTLTAGANIQIEDNIISATDTTYTAGTGISIVGNVISNTQTSAEWGNITGTLSAQTDLQNALNLKANMADLATVATTGNYSDLSGTPTIPTVNNATLTIQKNGTTVQTFTANASSNVTANISVPTDTNDLTNGAGYITSSALSGYATQTWVSQQGYLTEIPAEYVTDSELTAKGYQTAEDVETAITAKGYITNAALVGYATESYVTTAVGTEITARQNADNNLQSQIDAITASSDVTDIVGTYAELQSYDTSALPPNSIIKVLQDESRDDETTYYRWVITGGVGAWVLIGEEGPYYTKSQANSTFVPQTRTVNNKALSSNISLTASDVGALPDSTVIPTVNDATLTIQKNGTTVSTFTANASSNVTANISVPTDTSDLTNNAGFITSSALSGYATETWVSQQGYITGITSSDVTTALGYTPYNSSNPNGYTSNVGTVVSVNNTSPDSDGNVTISIPLAQVNSDWNAVSGVAQILNKPTIPTDTSDLTNGAGYITSSALTDYVTTNTEQDITKVKTFVGEKRIKFKQALQFDKLGFTLYNNRNEEVGAFEYNASSPVNNKPIMTLNNFAKGTHTTYVGFRYSGSAGAYNLLSPLGSDAKSVFNLTSTATNFYLPLGFTDGVTTVTTDSTGVLNVSSLLPTVNNATLTITQGGVSKGTFTANASSDVTIALDSGGDIDTLLATLYPVGAIYIGTQATCPLSTLISGSTWTIVGTSIITDVSIPSTIAVYGNGKTLGYTDGTNNLALLPGGDGRIYGMGYGYDKNIGTAGSGGNVTTNKYIGIVSDTSGKSGLVAKSNSITKTSITVNIWQRTA